MYSGGNYQQGQSSQGEYGASQSRDGRVWRGRRGRGGGGRGRGGRGGGGGGGRGRGGGGGGRGGGGRERPPPGLKGREIGMWYAQRSKEQTKEKEKQQVSVSRGLFTDVFLNLIGLYMGCLHIDIMFHL